jgi:hypothetical protein
MRLTEPERYNIEQHIRKKAKLKRLRPGSHKWSIWPLRRILPETQSDRSEQIKA